MSSPFTTLPATATDIPALSRLLCYSKQTLAITRLLQEDFGNETLLLARCVRAIEGSLNDPLAENVKMVDNNSGEIIGHLTMTIRKKTEDKEARSVPAITTGLNVEVLKAVNEAVSELKKIRDEEYLELTHIHIIPSHRLHGLGTHLINIFLSKAASTNLPIFLDATPTSHAFFLKTGCRDIKYVDLDLERWAEPYSGFGVFRLWGMGGGEAVVKSNS